MTPASADDLAARFARRMAERDNPPPPPPLSQEPAAVQARIEAWLQAAHAVGDPRGRLRLGRMLRGLMRHPELVTAQLAELAGLTGRAGGRTVARLGTLGLADAQYRGLYRYWRLTRAAEDALLLVVAGPQPGEAPL